MGTQFNYSKTRPWLYKDGPSGAAWAEWGRVGVAWWGRVGPVGAEWGWGGVGHALNYSRLGLGYKDRPRGRVGPVQGGVG